MKKNIIQIILLTAALAAASCGNNDSLQYGNRENTPAIPSPGSPSGNDVISSTTNHSDKQNETAPKLNPLAGAGYIKAPQINNYGTVTLSYPLDAPAGRAGLGPSVGLSYSSSGGDGLAGIGWSLGTGLGVISRTTQNGQLYYDYRDIFTFNGKRLVKEEGPANREEGTYRLEIESGFSKFILSETENGGTWRVVDKAGTVTVFGEDRDSRIYQPEDIDKTYIWNFTRSYDLNDNYMKAIYDTTEYEENHILYLKEIRYTGNYSTGMEPEQYVRFHYEEREDFYVSKAPGFIMKMKRLLKRVEIGWDDPGGIMGLGDNTLLWDYILNYETSEDSNRPLLKSIKSDRLSTSPEFFYRDANHQFVWRNVHNDRYNEPEINPEATKYFEGDFNGDGISDMVFFNPETGNWRAAQGQGNGGYSFPVYGNRFKGYNNEAKIQWFKGNVTGDYNGDGKSDIAFFLPETKEFYVAEHTGTHFNFKNYGKLSHTDIDIFKCEWFSGDYDGNGLSDSVLFNEPTGEWILMRNMGGRFEFIKFSQHFQNLYRDDYDPDMNMDSSYTADRTEYGKDRGKVHFLSGDYNGDGRTDISIYDSRSGKWWVAENYRDDYIGFRLRWKLYKEFTAPEQALFGHDRFSGDFNGDGFSDFLLFNRATDEWIIGETLDGTIKFRLFSKLPEHKEITRWLQGDFNGDGRTDIGYFSVTDNNFWIGEAIPNGFRYRIYNNLSYGPNTRVLEAPLPRDEVKIKSGTAFITQENSSSAVSYQYDGNYFAESGEKIFAGNFTNDPDNFNILVYNRSQNSMSTMDKTGSVETENPVITGIDLEDEDTRLLGNGIVKNYYLNNDALVYSKKGFGYGPAVYNFYAITYEDNFKNDQIAVVGTEINNFDLDKSFYLFGKFSDNSDDKKDLLVLNDNTNTPQFYIYENSENHALAIDQSAIGNSNRINFKNLGNRRAFFVMLSGKFTTGTTNEQVLIIDRSAAAHKWYLGTFTGSTVSFELLEGNPRFENTDDQNFLSYNERSDRSITYSNRLGCAVKFYRFTITGTSGSHSINQTESNILSSESVFNNEYDHTGAPVVYVGGKTNRVNIDGTNTRLEPINHENNYNISLFDTKREDLLTKVYKYRWIQGDYNGDGKTDIGIFHLKEQEWYFAVTEGTVPDMINKVNNGIGGIYEMEYANSSSFDNTGDDNIPDLPMNYKVCVKLVQDDSHGNRVSTKYEYSNGYAFSSFINGKKETDYFGFGTFKVIDALGSKTISTYYNTPYDDFRKNRALAGAIKENRFIGSDHKEYSRTEYTYKLHEIAPSSTTLSFLIEPVEVKGYMHDTHIETRNSNIVLTPDKYEMVSKTESVKDLYNDEVYRPANIVNYTEFENIESTNEMRLLKKISLIGKNNSIVDITRSYDSIASDYKKHETTTSFQYDNKGNLARQTVEYTGTGLSDPGHAMVSSFDYDNYGNVIVSRNESDSPFRITEKSYDVLKQFVVQERSIGDSTPLVTKYEINYNNAFGGISRKIDPNNNSTYFTYDYFGRLEKQEADINGSKVLISSYDYYIGFPMSVKLTRETGSSPIETRVFSDGMGRVIHSIQSALDIPGKRYTKTGELVYDALGRIIKKSQSGWAYDDEIDTYREHSREKFPTITEFDPSGRPKRVTLPKANPEEDVTSITYSYNDPWEVLETHSVGRSKRTVKNARGQVLYIVDSGTGDDGQTVSAKLGFAYDLSGKRIKKMDLNNAAMTQDMISMPAPGSGVKDSSGNNIAYWWYDGFGRLVASCDPDLGCSRFVYTKFGDVKTGTDANNLRTSMTYDRLGRLIAKSTPNGIVIYTYDSLSGCENALGRMVSIDDSAQKKIFSYDELGRIKKEIRGIKANDSSVSDGIFTTDFQYDRLNRQKLIDYPTDPKTGSRARVEYSYSPLGVSKITSSNGSFCVDIISSVDYNEFGQMDRVARGNGTVTNYSYDIKGRLSGLVTTTEIDGKVGKIQDVKYDFKVDNSIKSVENTPTLGTDGTYNSRVRYDYLYDGLNRLVHASGDYAWSSASLENDGDPVTPGSSSRKFERGYSYAANGNLSEKRFYNPDSHSVSDRWSYSYNNHAVFEIESSAHNNNSSRFEMIYDNVGNMVNQKDHLKGLVKDIVYDSYNRIIEVNDCDGARVGSYWYDDQGFRVRKVARKEFEGEIRQVELVYPSMYFGFEKQRTAEGVEIPETQSAVNNIYLNGVRVAVMTPAGKTLYYLTDQVDSVKVVVNDLGVPVSRMEYLPYGETWFQEGDEKHNPKYNSQELDKETGFYFYNARNYDPQIGRFVTADNVIDGEFSTQGWNRYMYVKGNPVVYRDPTGHAGKDGSPSGFYKDKNISMDIESHDGKGGNVHINKKNAQGKRIKGEKYTFDLKRKGFYNDKGVEFEPPKSTTNKKMFWEKLKQANERVEKAGGFKYSKDWLKSNRVKGKKIGISKLAKRLCKSTRLFSRTLGVLNGAQSVTGVAKHYNKTKSVLKSIKRTVEDVLDRLIDPSGMTGPTNRRQQQRQWEDNPGLGV